MNVCGLAVLGLRLLRRHGCQLPVELWYHGAPAEIPLGLAKELETDPCLAPVRCRVFPVELPRRRPDCSAAKLLVAVHSDFDELPSPAAAIPISVLLNFQCHPQ